MNWVMQNVLPQQAGLTVNALIYRYEVEKETEDDMVVDIRNKNAKGDEFGYIFSQKDDWSGVPGNSITQVAPINDIPIEYWGDGEIAVEGKGEVKDPFISYSYKYDTCFDPMSDPSCPGYENAMSDFLEKLLEDVQNVDGYYDPTTDEWVQLAVEDDTEVEEETEEEREEREKLEKDGQDVQKDERLVALQANNNLLAEVAKVSQNTLLQVMNSVPSFTAYYQAQMTGGVYEDVQGYSSERVPENRKGLRVGLAQQLLHTELVNSQYKQK